MTNTVVIDCSTLIRALTDDHSAASFAIRERLWEKSGPRRGRCGTAASRLAAAKPGQHVEDQRHAYGGGTITLWH
jgi:hypothetical protein